MRILHYLECVDLAKGGVVTAGMDMCEALLSQGVDVELLTGYEVDAPDGWRDGSTPHMTLTVDPSFICRYRPPEDLRKKIRPLLERCDVLHMHGVWNPLHRFLAAEAVAVGKPYVVTLHGMLDYWSMDHGGPLKRLKKKAFLALFGRKILQNAAAVQCTAQLEADAALHYVSGLKTFVLPCIVKFSGILDIERGAIPADPAQPQLLFLSRVHFKKRPDLLLDVAKALPEVRVVLAGPVEPEYEQELRDKAGRLGVADRVVWAGMLRGDDKLRAFAEADVFVLPTSQENFGIVLVEAMGAQLPVVTTKGTAIWPDLQEAGAWIVEQDPAALIDAIREVLAETQATAERARRGHEWVRQTLVSEALAPKYVAAYEKILKPEEGSA
ncbi:MAG: glycosyltransferase [Planctomycetota bacterium]